MKTILVVGGAGQVGSFLCAELCHKKNTKVVCVDNLVSGDIVNVEDLINRNNFEFVNLDFSQYQPWRAIDSQLDSRTRFNEIYYLAATRDVTQMYSSHLEGLYNALDMASHHKAAVMIVSEPHSRKKLDPNRSDGAYYFTKKAAEAIALAYQDRYRIKLTIFESDTNESLSSAEIAEQMIWD